MNPVIETIAFALFEIAAWFVLFPVVLAVASPLILIAASFQRGRYGPSVKRMYAGMATFWLEHYRWFIP